MLLAAFSPLTEARLPQENSIESLVKCLGREEHKIHRKKVSGALYELNQRMISELVMFNKINISPEMKKEICASSKPTPSVRLLEYLVAHQDKVFDLTGKINEAEKELYKSSIQEFTDIIPDLFFLYITHLQAATPRPSCLEEHIPELKSLLSDVKNLEGDIPIKDLLKQKNRGDKILRQLRNFQQINDACEEELKKQKEEEKKKREAEAKGN